VSYCPSCGRFYASSRGECPKCKVSLEKNKADKKVVDSYPIPQIFAGRIFFRNGGLVFKI